MKTLSLRRAAVRLSLLSLSLSLSAAATSSRTSCHEFLPSNYLSSPNQHRFNPELLQYFPSRWKQAQGKTLSAYPYILFPSVILAFYSELKIDPTEYQILLTDPPLNPSKNREKWLRPCFRNTILLGSSFKFKL
ncbi:uncharacterized protein [Malus domestica]|uniref:uncharacterized protein n=1 Tax=Malus domestica TaxID=3750 RepID=UPI0039760266